MEFTDITDPHRREELVQGYIQTKDELILQRENRKQSNLLKEQALEVQFRSVITATENQHEKLLQWLKTRGKPLEFGKLMEN